MDIIDIKYADMLAVYMQRFSKKSDMRWNFRCPVCGDSALNQSKARGWVYTKPNTSTLSYYCFNCSASMSFAIFLKTHVSALYDDYIMEKFKTKGKRSFEEETPVAVSSEVDFGFFRRLKRISQLPESHPAFLYVQKRKIPKNWYTKIYFSDMFMKFTNGIVPGKFKHEDDEDPRIIMPFFDKNKRLIGFQGRTIDPNNDVRYITISLADSEQCVFGMDTCDTTKPHLVLEGPIDSMFCRNSFSTAGSKKFNSSLFNENSIFVFDNEPRHPHTCKKIQGAINKGYMISLFPKGVAEKDINDYAIANEDYGSLVEELYQEACSGIMAQVKFNDWKKI